MDALQAKRLDGGRPGPSWRVSWIMVIIHQGPAPATQKGKRKSLDSTHLQE